MPRLYFLMLAAVLCGCARGVAQLPGRSHLLRAGLPSITAPTGGALSYEYRWNAKAGLHLQFAYQHHPGIPEEVFEGDWVNTYAEWRVDSFIVWSNQYLNHAEWQYVDANRPLPPAQSPYLPLNTLTIKVGYTMPFVSKNGRWGLLLQPGFFAGRHRYYSIEDDVQIFGVIENTQRWLVFGNEVRAEEQMRFFRQVRRMRKHNAPVYGLSYDLAVSAQANKRLFVELRGALGYNLTALTAVGMPAPARRFFGQIGLQFGYTFPSESKHYQSFSHLEANSTSGF